MTEMFHGKLLRKIGVHSPNCKCGAPRASARDGYCRECRKTYMRDYRKTQRERLHRLKVLESKQKTQRDNNGQSDKSKGPEAG